MRSVLRNTLTMTRACVINVLLLMFLTMAVVANNSHEPASESSVSEWPDPDKMTRAADADEDKFACCNTKTPAAATTITTKTAINTTNTTASPTTLPTTISPIWPAISITTSPSTPSITAASDSYKTTEAVTTANPGVIIGGVVGVCLLLILLAVLFVYREYLMRFCCNVAQKDTMPSIPSYVPRKQETSEPENSGTSASVSPIRKEFEELSNYSPSITSYIANLPKNAKDNSYGDVVPYDFNIVSLKSGNYINASHMESSFIMTQDPIMTQVDDFWAMVWEHNVSIIVRLSDEVDERSLPPAVYVPRKMWVVGHLEVTNVAEAVQRANYARRIIRLNDTTSSVRNKVREIYHYHLQCWETKNLPPVRDFMLALQDIRKQKKTFDQMGFTRTLVHCGSGSGRTGTFVAIWLLLDSVDAESADISVFKTVRRMREQRAHVVNRLELYKYIYECLEFYKINVDIPPTDTPYETVVGIGNSGESGESGSVASTTPRP